MARKYRFGENCSVVEDIKVSNEEYSHTVVVARMLLANEIVAQYFMGTSTLDIAFFKSASVVIFFFEALHGLSLTISDTPMSENHSRTSTTYFFSIITYSKHHLST